MPLLPNSSVPPGTVPLFVEDLTQEHVASWINDVQPHLSDDRPDKDWPWELIFPLTRLTGGTLGQRPEGFALTTPSLNVPCAMGIMVTRYAALDRPSLEASFIWYMASAPTSLLRARLSPNDIPKLLGQMALFRAVQRAHEAGHAGRLGLHADPKGGEKLASWYRDQHMQKLPPTHPLPIGFRRIAGNDGRYFYFNEMSAGKFQRSFRAATQV
jgi:hypothetical protein